MPLYAQNAKPLDLSQIEGPKPTSTYSEKELEKQVPPARPEDVASPEAIIRALHASVSGPQGEWNSDRWRSLFLPNVLFIFEDPGKDGTLRLSTISLDDLTKEVQRLHRQTAWYEQVVDIPSQINIRRESPVALATVSATGIEGTTPVIQHPVEKTATTTMIYLGKRWWIVSHTF